MTHAFLFSTYVCILPSICINRCDTPVCYSIEIKSQIRVLSYGRMKTTWSKSSRNFQYQLKSDSFSRRIQSPTGIDILSFHTRQLLVPNTCARARAHKRNFAYRNSLGNDLVTLESFPKHVLCCKFEINYVLIVCVTDTCHFQKLSETNNTTEFDFHWNSIPKDIGNMTITCNMYTCFTNSYTGCDTRVILIIVEWFSELPANGVTRNRKRDGRNSLSLKINTPCYRWPSETNEWWYPVRNFH